jgi:hypothetical protein
MAHERAMCHGRKDDDDDDQDFVPTPHAMTPCRRLCDAHIAVVAR